MIECELETRHHNTVVSLPHNDSSRFPCVYCRRLFRLNVIYAYVQELFIEACFHEAACIAVDMIQNTPVNTNGCKIHVKTFLLLLS